MDDCYVFPITKEYESQGCTVKINAAKNPDFVDVSVKNNKTCKGLNVRYVLTSNDDKGYHKPDIQNIQNLVNDLIDQYGDKKCTRTHFTNQILS